MQVHYSCCKPPFLQALGGDDAAVVTGHFSRSKFVLVENHLFDLSRSLVWTVQNPNLYRSVFLLQVLSIFHRDLPVYFE